jgi:two-component system phosphate regulon response regulator OmpR
MNVLAEIIDCSLQKHRILIIDDDRGIRTLLNDFLQTHSFVTETAQNAAEARAHLAIQSFDVIILDVMMPGEHGIELLSNIRSTLTTPIVLLTARDQLPDKLIGFEKGADDYITKPFEPLELVARIKSCIRRYQKESVDVSTVCFGVFAFELNTGHLKSGEHTLTLTSSERSLLRLLCQRLNQPFSRTELAQKISHCVSDRSVDVQINRLRQTLRHYDSEKEYIQTVRHKGYALIK